MEKTFSVCFLQSRCHVTKKEPVRIMVVSVTFRKGEQTAGTKEGCIKEKKERWHTSKLFTAFEVFSEEVETKMQSE